MLNKAQTAELLGYSPAGYSLIYHGHRRPSWEACERMKKWTNRTFEWFQTAEVSDKQKVFDRVAKREGR